MSSVTKNPLYLQSANYIYNYFATNNNKFDINLINTLEVINSDKTVVNSLKRHNRKKRYKNFERYNNDWRI